MFDTQQINTDEYAFFINLSSKQIGATQSFQGSFVVKSFNIPAFSSCKHYSHTSLQFAEIFYLMFNLILLYFKRILKGCAKTEISNSVFEFVAPTHNQHFHLKWSFNSKFTLKLTFRRYFAFIS